MKKLFLLSVLTISTLPLVAMEQITPVTPSPQSYSESDQNGTPEIKEGSKKRKFNTLEEAQKVHSTIFEEYAAFFSEQLELAEKNKISNNPTLSNFRLIESNLHCLKFIMNGLHQPTKKNSINSLITEMHKTIRHKRIKAESTQALLTDVVTTPREALDAIVDYHAAIPTVLHQCLNQVFNSEEETQEILDNEKNS